MSQPVVTRAVRGLEAYSGVALFKRGARGMVTTAIGLTVARRCDALLAFLRRGAIEARSLSHPRRNGATPERFASSVSAASLRAFVWVAVTQSETKAAAAIGISQPAVHAALRVLQERAGIEVVRSSRAGTDLTRAGHALLQHVKLALGEARAIESELSAWRGELRGRIVVGVLPLSVGHVLSEAISRVLGDHPETEIRVVEGTYDQLIRQLRTADIDVLVGALREPDTDVVQEVLFSDDLVVLARRGHPCLDAPTTLRGLLRWDWIVPLPATPAGELFNRAFALARLAPPRSTLQASSVTLIRALLSGSNRLAYSSRMQAREAARSADLSIVPVRLGGTDRDVGFALRAAGNASPDLVALIEALRECARAQDKTRA